MTHNKLKNNTQSQLQVAFQKFSFFIISFSKNNTRVSQIYGTNIKIWIFDTFFACHKNVLFYILAWPGFSFGK